VPPGIIDLFEVIKVDVQYSAEIMGIALVPCEGLFKPFEKVPAVRQIGEWIVECLMG